ncbi:MAG: DUF1801 domain-containing protein [Propionibacteriaceae bacterium]
MAEKHATVEAYIDAAPTEVRAVLEQIRSAIHGAVPGAGEKISYDMPTITLDGRSLVHFAAWKHHIGLYPLPAADESLTAELAPYNTGKGTARFPLDRPVPYELIGRVAQELAEQRATGQE